MTTLCAPASRAASTTLRVAATLTSLVVGGFRMERRTDGRAALDRMDLSSTAQSHPPSPRRSPFGLLRRHSLPALPRYPRVIGAGVMAKDEDENPASTIHYGV